MPSSFVNDIRYKVETNSTVATTSYKVVNNCFNMFKRTVIFIKTTLYSLNSCLKYCIVQPVNWFYTTVRYNSVVQPYNWLCRTVFNLQII